MATPGFLDLPVELLLLIFPYLDVTSFLNLTSTCRALHAPDLLYEPSYWSALVRATFRVPNQPVVEKDGVRWQRLFRRMLTQSRVYTWGNNEKACLGHAHGDWPGQDTVDAGGFRLRVRRRPHCTWPEMMQGLEGGRVVADLQCGGWSTTLLTSKGALYTVGVIDGFAHQNIMNEPSPLRYPPGFASPSVRHEPSTAIKQFSAGRAHILAISDSGRIWSWHDTQRPAFHVKFLHHDLAENGKQKGKGFVKKVVAGWNKSAALVEGSGIIVWEPLQRLNDDTSIADAALVMESEVVPFTSYSTTKDDRQRRSSVDDQSATLAEVGEISNFLILEEVVLFNTHLGKIFISQIQWDNSRQRITIPIEVPLTTEEAEEAPFVTDIQGSFKSFAVFTKSGEVLTSNQDLLLNHVHNRPNDRPLFTRIPALQHKDVIQVAFGDYHFHALHAPGYITSYGSEPQHCGAFGLGGAGGDGRLRGLRLSGRGDARLVPHAYTEGRRVWFEREKRAWVDFLISGGVDPRECQERVRMALGSPDVRCQGEVSEWAEQEGRDWEGKLGLKGEDEDGLGAYFALSVAAAGWHSGALVLVNEALAERMRVACEVPDRPVASGSNPEGEEASREGGDGEETGLVSSLVNSAISTASGYGRWFLGLPPPYTPAPPTHGPLPTQYGASPREGVQYIWANDHFPRLVLSDGTEMPGTVPFDSWRYKRPEWDLNVNV